MWGCTAVGYCSEVCPKHVDPAHAVNQNKVEQHEGLLPALPLAQGAAPMNEKTLVRRPYVRPMHGWWRRDPFFMRYMVRELTAFAVLAYAIVLTVGVVRLAQGEAAWNGWLAALRSPASIALHLVLLVAFAVHAQSWFAIMPKTMPMISSAASAWRPATITRAGWAATVVASIALFALAWRWAS